MAGRSKSPAKSGVHAILGADSYRAEQALEEILSEALGPDGPERAEGVESFRGDEAGWGRVAEAARTGSLFVSRRAVVFRNAELAKGDGEEIVGYLSAPTPGVTVVILAAKPDKRRTVWRRIAEAGTVHAADPLKGKALRTLVEAEVGKRGLRLAEGALDELIDLVGQDLRRLVGEIGKLEAFADGRALGPEDVARVLGRGLARPVWALGDAMAGRRLPQALEMAEEMLEEGEAALALLGTAHRALRQLRAARDLQARKASPDEIASRVGILPFKVRDVLAAARGWTDEELASALAAFHRADRLLKSGGDPRATLTAALVAACGGPGPGGPSGTPRGR